jgi:tripartite motif-containing protein 71
MPGGRRAILIGVIGALLAAAPASAADYRLVRTWELDNPSSIAVDADAVFVASTFHGSVTRYDPRGRRVTSWSGDLRRPDAVALGPQGRVYVADGERRIEIFDRDGTRLGGGPLTGPAGDALIPTDIDVDDAGEVYLAHHGSTTSDPGVVRYSATGQGLAAWGSAGAGDGQFTGPLRVAADGRGNVYVTDWSANRVQRFDTSGAYLGQWGQIGLDPGEFSDPAGVAVDPGGDVWVASDLGRVQRFDAAGRLRGAIDLSPRAISSEPADVGVDPDGRVYVADRGNPERMYVFAPTTGRCAKAERRVVRARKALQRLRARDASARRKAAAKRALRKAKQRRRAAC